jgi:alpha-amylase/alpha-mannosidase (GH57 family)
MERYICIHCHFYQPPRENPWLEAIELQDSAYPYHDWNARITAECYAPNAASRILDDRGRIASIVNNYRNISFNFGPTLLPWMEEHAPETYQAVLRADHESRGRFSGHGSAIAQAYNHMILPLANRRDRETQVRWGIRDFQRRFRRDPEGMWLPETAVDLETLEILADNGILFTILAPHQAQQVRKKWARGVWHSVEGAKIDPTRAYVCSLPGGKEIAIFFYDGPISRAVAFEKLLSTGENFAARLVGGFSTARRWPQLMHIATDGETYGHHHPHGDMALAYALNYIESNELARITNYGEYLEEHPPTVEVEIVEDTSWSCSHNIERWNSNCGCNSGGHEGWNQEWRGPLRSALNFLRDSLAVPYGEQARELLKDPWLARDDYINVVLDRSSDSLVGFFEKHATRILTNDEVTRTLKLLEMQRHLMLMYTSCGWFFDELSGIETVQVIFYAGRAIQLARELFGDGCEEQFLRRLALAESNIEEYGTGADLYNRWVKPTVITLLDVAAHYAISSLFDHQGEQPSIYCYDVIPREIKESESGRARLSVGHANIRSRITLESQETSFGVVHFGDHNLNAGVREFLDEDTYRKLVSELIQPFGQADLPGVLRQLDRNFEGATYSLKSLFRDEQRRVLGKLTDAALEEAGASYRHIYELYSPLMRFLSEVHVPLPRVLRMTAEFVINGLLHREFSEKKIEAQRVRGLFDAAAHQNVELDAAGLGFALQERLAELTERLLTDPHDLDMLKTITEMATLARTLSFEVNFWKAQNGYYQLLQTTYPEMTKRNDDASRYWIEQFRILGEQLNVRVEPLQVERPVAA